MASCSARVQRARPPCRERGDRPGIAMRPWLASSCQSRCALRRDGGAALWKAKAKARRESPSGPARRA